MKKWLNIHGFTGVKVIIVFDAYIVKGLERKYRNFNIEIIFTKEKETADERIEKLANQLVNRTTKVFVATSDYAEQGQIFGKGAFRKSARELYNEIKEIEKKISKNVDEIKHERPISKIPLTKEVLDFFERFRRGE